MKILVIIPAYNEAENIVRVVDEVMNSNVSVDYVVINDCSKDSTKELLKKHNFCYIDLPINLGIGGGVQTGYRYALDKGYDIAIQFDGDGQHNAAYIQNLIAPIEAGEADFTIGSRFVAREGFQSSGIRRLGINMLSALIYVLCGTKINDVTSGMRAVNKSLIAFFAENYAQDYPEPEAILTASMEKARIREVPVQMRERTGGVSSINALRSIYYMIKVSIALILSRVTYRRTM